MNYLEDLINIDPLMTGKLAHNVQTLSIDVDSILTHSAEQAWSYGSFEIKISEDEQKNVKHHIIEKKFNKLVMSSLTKLVNRIDPGCVLILSL